MVSTLIQSYALGDIFVLAPRTGQRSLVELKGRGCRQFESHLLAQQRSWYEFLWTFWWLAVWMKRLDLLLTIRQGFKYPCTHWKCQQESNVFRSSGSFKAGYRSGELVRKEEKECMGNTSISVHYKVKFISYLMKRTTSSIRKNDTSIEDAEVKTVLRSIECALLCRFTPSMTIQSILP